MQKSSLIYEKETKNRSIRNILRKTPTAITPEVTEEKVEPKIDNKPKEFQIVPPIMVDKMNQVTLQG